MRRWIVAGLLVTLAGAGGWTAWRLLSRPSPEDLWELPAFEPPPAGPRAPTTELLGVRVGFTTFDELAALLAARGVACEDTSKAAIINRMKAKRATEAEARAAAGEPDPEVDGKSGATAKGGKAPGANNPQIRLRCKGVPSDRLGDRARPAVSGRWLFVFDSPKHPLRHVSYRRQLKDRDLAVADYWSALDAAKMALGEPSEVPEALPPRPGAAGGPVKLGPYRPHKVVWRFSDAEAQVNLVDYGGRGADVLEQLEVPWPLVADAPAR